MTLFDFSIKSDSMSALFKIRMVVYSVEARKIAVTEIELPVLAVGSYVMYQDVTLRIDSIIYDSETHMMVYMCGYLVQSVAGNVDGFMLYFPYGHIPKDIFQDHFSTWKIVEEEDLDDMFHTPVISVMSPQFKNMTYVY